MLTVSAEWISDFITPVSYNVTSNTEVIYHTITFEWPELFSEVNNQAGWGTVYYATKNVSDHNPLQIVIHSRLSSIPMFHAQYLGRITLPSNLLAPLGLLTTPDKIKAIVAMA